MLTPRSYLYFSYFLFFLLQCSGLSCITDLVSIKTKTFQDWRTSLNHRSINDSLKKPWIHSLKQTHPVCSVALWIYFSDILTFWWTRRIDSFSITFIFSILIPNNWADWRIKALDEELIQSKMKSLTNPKHNVQNTMIHCQSHLIFMLIAALAYLFYWRLSCYLLTKNIAFSIRFYIYLCLIAVGTQLSHKGLFTCYKFGILGVKCFIIIFHSI